MLPKVGSDKVIHPPALYHLDRWAPNSSALVSRYRLAVAAEKLAFIAKSIAVMLPGFPKSVYGRWGLLCAPLLPLIALPKIPNSAQQKQC